MPKPSAVGEITRATAENATAIGSRASARFTNSTALGAEAAAMAGIKAVRAQIVARDDDDRHSFLRKRGFSKAETEKVIATVLDEEGHPPASIFDFVQGITALARDKPHQDARR